MRQTRRRRVFLESLEARLALVYSNTTPDVIEASSDGVNLTLTQPSAAGDTRNLSVSFNAGQLIIAAAKASFVAAPAGWALKDGMLQSSATAFTGAINIVGGAGDDTLVVNLVDGQTIPTINYEGGAGGFDTLEVHGGTPGDVTFDYTNGSDGDVIMSNFGTVNYSGLEPVLTDFGSAPATATFNLPAGPSTAMLEEDFTLGNGIIRLRSANLPSTFEMTDFTSPIGTLTINRGNAADTLTVSGVSDFNASLIVGSAGSPFQSSLIDSALSLTGTAGVSISAGTITTSGPITTTGGTVTFSAAGDITIQAPVVTNGGVQTFTADSDANGSGVFSLPLLTAQLVDPNPNPGNQFGSTVRVLTSGNVVVTSPFDDAGGSNAGAVYLFNGRSGALLSTLRGSTANDNVGVNGVSVLPNGNYIVHSIQWNNIRGAVTWGSGTTGVGGVLSAANSLIGSSSSDAIGNFVTFLSNGNYVVSSYLWDNGVATDAGAVTWGNGTTGISGVVSSANSLVGSKNGDQVGNGGATALTNGNYVVRSPSWNNGTVTLAGAVTWGNGTTGIIGVVSGANSLVGSTNNDQIGDGNVTVLTNGNYVVNSYNWDNGTATDAGAATWGNGSTGITGVVSAANSLVGNKSNDHVGGFGGFGVSALPNGNYVVNSINWGNAAATNAGAVTWGNGATGTSGVVSAANSLVGSTTNDFVGEFGVTFLNNGNFVIRSPHWDNGAATDAGAVTWGSGTSGISGLVSAATSLVGSTSNDKVGGNDAGTAGVQPLPNGNYVVISPFWDNGAASDAGSVTWGSGVTGITGAITSGNSLVGNSTNNNVGYGGVALLTNGNYVVVSPFWGSSSYGAVTWGNGASGITGFVSSANSLTGSSIGDSVGKNGVTPLANGNYLVISSVWRNGAITSAGAITWANGSIGLTGIVTTANSLVGSPGSDNQIGSGGVRALSNGNYVVISPLWDNGSATDAGAVTWVNGNSAFTGVVSAANSLVGSNSNDNVGKDGVYRLVNGNYVVSSYNWDNGGATNAGAVTWGNGASGITGVVSAANSLVGSTSLDVVGSGGILELTNGNYVVSSRSWDNGGATDAGAVTWGNGASGSTGVVSAANSLVGSTSFDAVGSIFPLPNGNYVVSSSVWDNGGVTDAGAVTWGNGISGITGVVSASNSAVGLSANSGSGISVTPTNAASGTFYIGFRNDGGGRLITGSQANGFAASSGLTSGAASITISAADVNLTTAVSSSALVTLVPTQLTRPIDLGANTAGQLGLTDSELDQITAGTVQLGNGNTGTITISAAITHSNNLALTTGAGVTFNNSLTLASNKTFTADALGTVNGTINFATANADLATTGTGAVSLTTARNLSLSTGASVTTVDGGITLSANRQATPTSGNFTGVLIDGALIQATGTGTVTVRGKGGDASVGAQHGVNIRNGGDIVGGTSGAVTVQGTGGPGVGGANWGVNTENSGSTISSSGASVSIVGTGGTGSGAGSGVNIGVHIQTAVSAGGSGSLTITGTGGTSAAGSNWGVYIHGNGSSVTTSAGSLIVTGSGGAGSSGDNTGVLIGSGLIQPGGGGTATVNGTAGDTGPGGSFGVIAAGVAAAIRSSGGAINVNGTGTVNSEAIRLQDNAVITSGGNASISITGDSFTIVDATSQINSGTGVTTIRTRTAGTLINVGGADILNGSPLTLGLTDAELDRITAGIVRIGESNSGTITVSAAITHANHLSLTTGAGIDVNQAVTMATNKNFTADSLGLVGGTIRLPNAASDISTSGSGEIWLATVRNIELSAGAAVTSGSGSIELSANFPGSAAGNFPGVKLTGGLIGSAAGNISVYGRGGNTGAANHGVLIQGGGSIGNGTTGTVVVNGVGGESAGNDNDGIVVTGAGSQITSGGGDIVMSGTGGGATAASIGNNGVHVLSGGAVAANGLGSLSITATGGQAGGANPHGLIVGDATTNGTISTANGALTITGTGTADAQGIGVTTGAGGATITAGNGALMSLIGDTLSWDISATFSTIGTATIRQKTNGRPIKLGTNSNATELALSDPALDRLSAGTLQFGDANSGPITVSADITRPTATNMRLISGSDVNLSVGQVNTAGGTLLLDAGNVPAAIRPTKSGVDVVASTLSFASGDGLGIVVNGTAVDSQYTQLNVAGAVNLTGAVLIISGGYAPGSADVFTLINNDGVDAIVGTFTGLPEGSLVVVNGGANVKRISYVGGDGNDVVLKVPPTTMWVTNALPTTTGARFTLSQAAAIAGVLNLYDFRDTAGASVMGAADVQLIGQSGGAVAGSLIVAPGGTTFSFVSTNGVLPPDNYTLRLRSAADGFKTVGGQQLDGNADGTVGDDFTTTFTVAAPPVNAVTLSLPNFARGPQQAVNVPESSALGLPLSINSGGNLVSMTFELQFDSGLLNVTDITLAAGISGSKSFSLLSPGRAQVTLTFSTPLTGGSQTVAYFTANVPTSAANRYGERGVLDLTNISLLASGSVSVPAIDQDAAHVNAYLGDVSRDGSYNSFDVQQVSRAAVGLDTGYQQHLLLDPRIISDFDGSAGINSFDVQRVSRLAVGLSIPEAPPLPVPPVTVNSNGNLTSEQSVDKPESPSADPVVAPSAPIATPPATTSAPQHNAAPGFRSDVDNDGVIDAQDILWAVFLYNQSLKGLPTLSDPSAASLFADVNGDNQIDPSDILFAVSDFNLRPTGEGEAAAMIAPRKALASTGASVPAEDLDSLAYLLATDLETVKKRT